MGFSQETSTKRLTVGDRVAFYATQGVKATNKEGRLFALGKMAGPVDYGTVKIGTFRAEKTAPIDFELTVPVGEAPAIRPLIEDLRFVYSKKNWAPYLRKTIVNLFDEADYELIASTLRSAAHITRRP